MRHEAIDELKKYTSGRKNTEKIEVSVLTLNRIISALEQEPYEDAISRQAVMEHYSTGEIAHCHHVSRNNLLDFIEQLPPVTLQELILDKIRTEIESQREEVSKKHSEDEGMSNYYFGLNDGLKDARDIIDKYKSESEE